MQLPTVTTRATGAVDSVRDGRTGLLVDVDASEQLAAAVATLLDDVDLRARLGAAGRSRIPSSDG